MSIKINKAKCVSCGKCIKVCPGSLLYSDENNKAYIKYPSSCWGCTACLKECRHSAINYYLEPDVGGNGTYMYTTNFRDYLEWIFVNEKGEKKVQVNKKESNKY